MNRKIIMVSLGIALACGIIAVAINLPATATPEQSRPARATKPVPCQKTTTFPGMEKIYRNPELHKGSCYEWSGQVTQSFPSKDFVVRTSFYAPYSDGRIYVLGNNRCIGSGTTKRVLKGDHVTFAGEFILIGEHEMTGGSTESWPLVKCHILTPSQKKIPEGDSNLEIAVSASKEIIVQITPREPRAAPREKTQPANKWDITIENCTWEPMETGGPIELNLTFSITNNTSKSLSTRYWIQDSKGNIFSPKSVGEHADQHRRTLNTNKFKAGATDLKLELELMMVNGERTTEVIPLENCTQP